MTERQREAELAKAIWEASSFRGEALMRLYLNLTVASDQFEDNASPGFLVNPFTGQLLQLDRYYPPDIAFEYNGAQHYVTTERFPDAAELRNQQGRGLLKEAICQRRGIKLVVVHAEDLSVDGMCRKVADLLPRRTLDGHEPLIEFLESVSGAYRGKVPLGLQPRKGGAG